MTMLRRRPSIAHTASLRMFCRRCRHLVTHRLRHGTMTVSLGAISLFSITKWYELSCASCGVLHPLNRTAAKQLKTAGRRTRPTAITAARAALRHDLAALRMAPAPMPARPGLTSD
jgi:hypothetical protein